MYTFVVGTVTFLLDPINVVCVVVAIFLQHWWQVPITALVIALAVEVIVVRGTIEFVEMFTYNFGTALGPRFATLLIIMAAVYLAPRLLAKRRRKS